jgi:SAM-dependent methyltransferase
MPIVLSPVKRREKGRKSPGSGPGHTSDGQWAFLKTATSRQTMSEHSPKKRVGQIWDEHFQAQEHAYRLEKGLPFLRKFIRSPFIQDILRYANLKRNAKVLEVGCGSGKFSFCFALLGCDVTALDFSTTILQNVAASREKLEQETGRLSLTLHHGDLEKLDLPSESFDLVFNEGVIEHWLDHSDRRAVIAQMVRVARPGGTVAVIVPNGFHPLINYWERHAPGYLSAPPMVHYHPDLLSTDLQTVGLEQIKIDGLYAWRTLDYWPTSNVRRLAGGALQRLVPLPYSWRLKWGIHLIGLGRKK